MEQKESTLDGAESRGLREMKRGGGGGQGSDSTGRLGSVTLVMGSLDSMS